MGRPFAQKRRSLYSRPKQVDGIMPFLSLRILFAFTTIIVGVFHLRPHVQVQSSARSAPSSQSASSPASTLPPGTIFDNPMIRVRRIRKEPRQKTAVHHIPALLHVALTPLHNLVTFTDGSTKEESYAAGDVAWWNGGERGAENLEDKAQEFLTVWPKETPPGAIDVTLPLSELRVKMPGMAQMMIFDNDRLRVTRMAKLPHEPSKEHDAPGRLLVFLTDGHLRCTFRNQPVIDNVVKAGDVVWWPSGLHVSENVGEQEVKFLLIVPKLQIAQPGDD